MEWLSVADLVVSIIMVLVTIALVFITRRYVILTGELVKSNSKPEILVYLRPDEDNLLCVNLWVENVGTGLAYNVEFTPADPSFAPDRENSLGNLGLIREKIDYWGPGHKTKTFLTSVVGRQDLFEQEPFKIDVTYEDSEKTPYRRSFSLDFKQWENVSEVPTNSSKMAKALEGIQGHLKKTLK